MKRRSFFASLAGLVALPAFVKAKPKYPLISNKDVILPIETMTEPYGLKYARAIYLEWKATCEQGELIVKDGYFIINQWDKQSARVGDSILTNKTDHLLVIDSYQIGEDSSNGWRKLFQYKCQLLSAPKRICGVPVVKVDGKWRRYKQRDQFEHYKIEFTMYGRQFHEGTLTTSVGSDLHKWLDNHPRNNKVFKRL